MTRKGVEALARGKPRAPTRAADESIYLPEIKLHLIREWTAGFHPFSNKQSLEQCICEMHRPEPQTGLSALAKKLEGQNYIVFLNEMQDFTHPAKNKYSIHGRAEDPSMPASGAAPHIRQYTGIEIMVPQGLRALIYLYLGQKYVVFVHERYIITHFPMSRSVNNFSARCKVQSPIDGCWSSHTLKNVKITVCS